LHLSLNFSQKNTKELCDSVLYLIFVLRQLQKITDIIELILVTEEINIEEIAFPEWPVDKQFMLYIKGSPHDVIESFFIQTNIKWKITEVEHNFLENEPIRTVVSENEENIKIENNDDFFESQYAILVKDTMRQMRIGKREAKNQIQIWFHWKMKDGKNNPHLLKTMENNTISEVKKYLEESDALLNNTHELQNVPHFFQYDSGPNNGDSSHSGSLNGVFNHFMVENQNRLCCCHDNVFESFYTFLIFGCKSLILLSMIILFYILHTNEKHSSNFKNIMLGIFP